MASARLQVESLETKDVPATFGLPWADGDFLTVSFAPDGTKVDGSTSKLFRTMRQSGLSDAAWQAEIAKAFQAWATPANLNFGIVADNGGAIGTSGSLQADARFGDIRIFAAPLSNNVLAITAPPDAAAGTRAGDIILNSNLSFGIGANAQRDLYTVMLQEVGHAIGVANQADSASVMYENYGGVKSGLSSADKDLAQGLYGIRWYNLLETMENLIGNGASWSASPLPEVSGLAGGTIVTKLADVTTSSDVDWYKFTCPTGVGSLKVELRTAGGSLLGGSLTVLNSSQSVIGSSVATGPGQDLSVQLSSLASGSTYYIKIQAASGTAFPVGLYRLRLVPANATSETISVAGLPKDRENFANETIATATSLLDLDSGARRAYMTTATLVANEVDYYRIKSSTGTTQEVAVLSASVRALSGGVAPGIKVFDLQGNPLTAVVRADGQGLYAIDVDGVAPDTEYIVQVVTRSGVSLPCDHQLDINFRNRPAAMSTLVEGTLASNVTSAGGTLTVARSVQMAFELSAPTGMAGETVTLNIRDSSGKSVFSLVTQVGNTVSGIVLLTAGNYTVTFTCKSPNNSSLGTTGIRLNATVLTDPIGVAPSNPSIAGSGTAPPPVDYKIALTGLLTATWLAVTVPTSGNGL